MSKDKIYWQYPLILALFAGIAGIILAIMFQITEPRKVLNLQKIENQARQEVLAQASVFQQAKIGQYSFVKGLDANRKLKGYVLKVSSRGYSSDIKLLVGLDDKFNLVGLKVLAQAETPGLGTKITQPWFTKQFLGKPLNVLAVKKDGGELDSITGATITSRAAVNGVRKEIELFKNLLQIKGNK